MTTAYRVETDTEHTPFLSFDTANDFAECLEVMGIESFIEEIPAAEIASYEFDDDLYLQRAYDAIDQDEVWSVVMAYESYDSDR